MLRNANRFLFLTLLEVCRPKNVRLLSVSSLHLNYCVNKQDLLKRNAGMEFAFVSNPLTKKQQFSTSSTENDEVATYEEVKELPKHKEKLLIDVREPEELRETGYIPASISIPLDYIETTLSSAQDKKQFQAKYGRDFPGIDQEIIFTCRSGKRAQFALEIAKKLGFKNLKNYRGSWLDWAEHEGLPK